MPPKNKKTKAEEALDFLSNLDNLDDTPGASSTPADGNTTTSASGPKPPMPTGSGSTPRQSTDSSRPARVDTPGDKDSRRSGEANPAEDEEAAKALAFLEAQINTKRQPLTVAQVQSQKQARLSRPSTPSSTLPQEKGKEEITPTNVPSAASGGGGGGGWGSSWWSTATSAVQAAQKIADEQYQKVKTEGVGGVTGGLGELNVKGVDLAKLRKEAEERFGGMVKGVDLEKLRHDLYNNTSSALNNIINTVAPPISAHETLELWLSHPMTGYAGVEGVVYRAWMAILEQTESGELVIVWSPSSSHSEDGNGERGIHPVEGFEEGWQVAQREIGGTKEREEKDPKGRKQNGNTPVTTVPIFLHLQPVLAPLSIPEPPLLLDTDTDSTPSTPSQSSPKHLQFILTLHDPVHNLRFTTLSQPVPADWLEVEYDQSEWVEERLVDVIRVGVEIIAQDYVATRMALKPSSKTVTRPASPKSAETAEKPSGAEVKKDGEKEGAESKVEKKDD